MNETNPTPTQPETLEMPERLYIPHGPAMLMAVSPELQNNEGAWYNLETDDGDLRSRILALKTECQGELPSMYNKAIDDAVESIGATKPREDTAISARNRDEAQQVVLDTEAALEEKFDGIARHELVNRITAALDTRRAAVAGPRGDATLKDFPDSRHWQPVEENCEACVRGYRLAPDGLHYDDDRGGQTWGICRKVVAATSSPAPAEKAQPPDPYAVVIYREEAAKMAFDAIQSALQDDWAEHYSVLQIAGMIATNIRRISPAAPAESTRVAREVYADYEKDPVTARRAAEEWMDTYHGAFKTNKEREDALAAIISKHFAAAPADNDAEHAIEIAKEVQRQCAAGGAVEQAFGAAKVVTALETVSQRKRP